MFRGRNPCSRGPLARRRTDQLPGNGRLPAIHRLEWDAADGASHDPLARDPELALLEALLLIADEPLPVRKLVQTSGLADAATVRRRLKELQGLYERDECAFQMAELAGGFQLMTRPEFQRWLGSVRPKQQDMKLTAAARETLAIIAYRQPIMRADVEAIRGVHCGETLRLLMERGLVKITGRHDSLGRPVLYGTTKQFLQTFGLRNLKDLPPIGTRPTEKPDAGTPD